MALVIPKRTDKPKSGLVIPERNPSKITATPVVKSNLPATIKTVGGKPSLEMNPSQKEQTIKPYIPPRPLSFFGDMINGAFDSVKGTVETTARLNTKAVQSLVSANKDVVERAKQNQLAPEYLKKQSTPLERAVNIGVAAASTAGTIMPEFLAFGAELEAAKNLPGPLSAPAKAFGYGLEKLGELGSFSANKGIDALPVSEDTKNAMRPVADEISPLIAQLVGMKIVGAVSGGKVKLDKKGEPLPKTKVGNAVDKAKFGVSLSLQPFSTAYGLVGARVASKVAEKQQQGIDITPEVGKKIVDEVKQEIQTQGLPNIDEQGSINPQEAPKVDKTADPLIQEARKYKSSEEFVKNQLKKNSFTSDKPIKVYRGEGGGIGNSTLVRGRYFADSKDFASNFGDVTEEVIPAGTKIFDLDTIKDGNGIVSDEMLVNPDELSKYLIDNGFQYTKNTNTRGVEYVKLFKNKIDTLADVAKRFKNKIKFLEHLAGNSDEAKKIRDIGYDFGDSDVAWNTSRGVYRTGEKIPKQKTKLEEIWKKANTEAPVKQEITTQGLPDIQPDGSIKPQEAPTVVKVPKVDKKADPLIQEARKYKSAEEFVNEKLGTKKQDSYSVMVGKEGSLQQKFNVNAPDVETAKKIASENYLQDMRVRGRVVSSVSDKDVVILDAPKNGKDLIDFKIKNQEKQLISIKEKAKTSDFYKKFEKSNEENLDKLKAQRKEVLKLEEIWKKANTEAPVKKEATKTSGTKKFESSVYKRMKEERPFSLADEGKLDYESINLKKEAEKAVSLVEKDKNKAYRIAIGAEKSKDVTSTSVNIALSEKALSEGNFDLYAKLIKSRSLEQTRRGQEIVSERGSISDNSTATYVKKLIASRLDKLGDRYLSGIKELSGKKTTSKTKATKILDNEIAKAQSKIKNKELDIKEAQSIIDRLSC